MLFLELGEIELTGGHIEKILFIEMEKQELIGGHIETMLFFEMELVQFVSPTAILNLYYSSRWESKSSIPR